MSRRTTLRHTYATALFNAGVSLQALMALLGHESTAMSCATGARSLRPSRRVRARPTFAKERLGPVLPEAVTEAPAGNWRELPLIKSSLAGGYCLRTGAQDVCPHTNICKRGARGEESP